MEHIALGWLIGALLCQQLPALPPPALGWLIVPLALLLWRTPRWRGPVALILGLLWAAVHGHARLAGQLPQAWTGGDIVIEGQVAEVPRARSTGGLSFLFAAQRAAAEETWRGTVRLTWPGTPPADLAPGQTWRLTVRLKPFHGQVNPGTWDSEAQAFQQDIMASGYVRPRQPQVLLAPAPAWEINRLRGQLYRQTREILADQPRAGLVPGLTLGLNHGISQTDWRLLRQTGTTHLLVISGQHIALVALMVFWIARAIWAWSGRLALYLPAPYFAAGCALAAGAGYAMLAGMGIPVQRALVMLGVLMLGLLSGRTSRLSQSLSLALIAVLAWDPLAVSAPGFWLSFTAVAILGLILQRHARPRLDWLRVHWLMAVGLGPMLLLWFNQAPLASPLANLLAVPLVGFLIVPLALLGTLILPLWPSLGGLLLEGAAYLLDGLWFFLTGLQHILHSVEAYFSLPDNLAGGVWYSAIPPGWRIALALAGAFWLLLPPGFPGRWLGALWLLPALFAPAPRPEPGELWFTLLDVGQGLSAVLRTREHVLVYDTGPPGSAPDSDSGNRIIAPYLRGQGIHRVDRLVISHWDLDHSGGLPGLQAEIPIDQIIASQPAHSDAHRCAAGQAWEWDGVRFEFLHPAPDSAALSDNNSACVLRASSAGQAVLLSSDIERNAENELLRRPPLRATILVVPHHGSKTSSTPAFVAAVRPDYALFSVGCRNRFSFPKAEIVARYLAQGSAVLTTAEYGAIHFSLSPQGVSPPHTARQARQRYWAETPACD